MSSSEVYDSRDTEGDKLQMMMIISSAQETFLNCPYLWRISGLEVSNYSMLGKDRVNQIR